MILYYIKIHIIIILDEIFLKNKNKIEEYWKNDFDNIIELYEDISNVNPYWNYIKRKPN